MAICLDRLPDLSFPPRVFDYDERDTMLYALSIGFGHAGAAADLDFIYEKALQAVPTQATVIAWEDTWQERIGLDVSKVVHGEMRLTSHRPLAPRGRVEARFQIRQLIDKGPGRGALVLAQTDLFVPDTGAPIATLLSTVFARGDGGFGGTPGSGPAPHALPQRPAETVTTIVTRPEQAALYRLNGDRNPLHVDPAFADAAGFERPILHGLCTWGMVAGQVVRARCGNDASRLAHFEARFTAPVFPGETLLTELWMDADVVSFRTRAADRGTLVLDHGKAIVRPPGLRS